MTLIRMEARWRRQLRPQPPPVIIPAEGVSGHLRPDEDVEVPNPGQESPSVSSSEEEPTVDAAPASPFSYAELEVKLKTDYTRLGKPSSPLLRLRFMYLLFLFACQLVRGLRGMAQQHDLFYSAAADCRLYEDLLLSAPRD
ncbi:hypothetical protein CK203_042434 [Vitis vinifera]|uniref:Uncharacterized protein n=1 Tax=Vitis vinifera TaxID=29760 RepID=A0A438HES8_VITVI|nr:hypothetical protein CK203_042434 [Vitis vinifera]